MIKKILALALALCMVFAFAACGGGDKESKGGDDKQDSGIVGEWVIKSVEANGQKVEGGDALAAYDYAYTFKEDGTASVSVMGETVEYEYTFKDNEVTFADQTTDDFSLKLEGGNLVLEYSSMAIKITFEKK
ncbi:MAG: hypothetical protein LBL36_03170 [Clostridiales Family XIII bacterium]|jgi:uncharacterized lipoprotein YehR (DUF1307 family)|nr:hypothetical protein [Clostridiales Family XIII bacterium]